MFFKIRWWGVQGKKPNIFSKFVKCLAKKNTRKWIFMDKCFCGMLGEECIDKKLKYTQFQFTGQEDSLMN